MSGSVGHGGDRWCMVFQRTNRFTPTQFACVSLHDVHWTLNVYQKGFPSVSSGRRLVTLGHISERLFPSSEAFRIVSALSTHPPSSAVTLRAYILGCSLVFLSLCI